jgi:hypothetical protein
MPKDKKLNTKVDDDKFDDMLAELAAGDLAIANNASSPTTTSRSSSTEEPTRDRGCRRFPVQRQQKPQDKTFLRRPSSGLA